MPFTIDEVFDGTIVEADTTTNTMRASVDAHHVNFIVTRNIVGHQVHHDVAGIALRGDSQPSVGAAQP